MELKWIANIFAHSLNVRYWMKSLFKVLVRFITKTILHT